MSSQPEDLNEFDALDCGLATLMLCEVPAIIFLVLGGGMQSLVLTGLMAVAGFVVALAVWGLACYTNSRVVGLLVNWAGCVLTPLYIAVSVYLWIYGEPRIADEPPAEEAVPVQVAPVGETR